MRNGLRFASSDRQDRLIISAICFCALIVSMQSVAQDAPKLNAALNEQVVMLPVGSGGLKLETTIFKPAGDGPFPLVVINHGKASGNPRFQGRATYPVASAEFVRLGYLVALPMRQGFSKSEGGYVEPGCNIASNGLMQAEDLRRTLDTLVKRPDVDPARILVIGQSHGGLTTIAFGSGEPFPGVKGLINFAGGFKMTSCQWDLALISAFEKYGRTSKIPTLWFYGDNDSYWGPTAEIPTRMYEAYTKGGGRAKLIAFGRFDGGDAHSMFTRREGREIWLAPVMEFLQQVGLPNKEPAR